MFYTIFVQLAPFGCVTKLSVKRANLMKKFVPRSRLGIFHNERIRTTPLDPKLTIWSVTYYFSEFGTVWLPYETRCKTGRTSVKVRAMKSRRNFLQRMHMFWCISYYLGAFRAAWLPYETRCKMVRTSSKVSARMSRWNFTYRTHPIHPIGP